MMGALDRSTDPAARVTAVLADLGCLVRRVQAGSLGQDDFYGLVRNMRTELKALRIELRGEIETIELTDLGAQIGALLDSGQVRPAAELFDQLPDRTRTYGRFAVIDGGRPFETPYEGD